MRIPKFTDIAAFIRFKRFWLVSSAQERARMSQHCFYVQKQKKSSVFSKKNNDAAKAEAEDARVPWTKSR